jgi:type IV secretion system protein VirB5
MKALKKIFGAFTLVLGLAFGNSAHAGIPVIDAANLAQSIQQVVAWAQQYEQMVQQIEQDAQQIQQMQQQYQSLNGVRGMASLVNNPATRQYLPADYQQILSNGVGQWQQIYDAAKRFDMASSSLSGSSDTVQAFNQIAKQAALNRAGAEEGYKTASQRFSDIQVLLDKVNAAPDAKDIADLQGRIQAEQVMMQNEANKLAALQQLAQAQRDLQEQQTKELQIKSDQPVDLGRYGKPK